MGLRRDKLIVRSNSTFRLWLPLPYAWEWIERICRSYKILYTWASDFDGIGDVLSVAMSSVWTFFFQRRPDSSWFRLTINGMKFPAKVGPALIENKLKTWSVFWGTKSGQKIWGFLTKMFKSYAQSVYPYPGQSDPSPTQCVYLLREGNILIVFPYLITFPLHTPCIHDKNPGEVWWPFVHMIHVRITFPEYM